MLKNNVPINIIIDGCEHKNGVIKSLAGIENVTIRIRKLSIGDYPGGKSEHAEETAAKIFWVQFIFKGSERRHPESFGASIRGSHLSDRCRQIPLLSTAGNNKIGRAHV